MKVYRLSRRKYAEELSGKGAAMVGGRWNSRGTELIYTAQSRALAMAEVAVHLTLATLPDDFVMVEIDIPDVVSVSEIGPKELSKHWNSFPYNLRTQSVGDEFVKAEKNCLLKIPSAVVPGDHNFLINPKHVDFNKISISSVENFPFDERLFR